MCGVIGVAGPDQVSYALFYGLNLLQHRGQDAAGIATMDHGHFFIRKNTGLVSDVFTDEKLEKSKGNMGIGHVRYPTAGSLGAADSQPFYVNNPHGIVFVHNGNLTNVPELAQMLHDIERRHLNTSSDSELLLNFFACGMNKSKGSATSEAVYKACKFVFEHVKGGYACTAMIANFGLIAFRDPYGIRPLVLGFKEYDDGEKAYMVASESVALDISGFKVLRDVEPGEVIIITEDRKVHSKICAKNPVLAPCLFEYVYFARPDSIMNGVSVYQARVDAGKILSKRIKEAWKDKDIDIVIPIPETGRASAQEIATALGVEYREGFVKNRYVGRTFIMPENVDRKNFVRRKLNPIPAEFRDKNVLLVDDSIVRGTTSKRIIEMIRDLGAKSVYLASVSPAVRYPNVYGIDMPVKSDLIAHGKTIEEIRQWIGVDGLIYLPLEDLKEIIQKQNPKIREFEDSVFSGNYITGDVDDAYLDVLEKHRKELKELEKKYKGFDN
ncbi:amidophosphoribosyltransferase [Francisella tularensis]|uniref:amidophosphoribosyltransferase n=1 Tax=Francisella tularensis TaxID=263 RepID=UPI001980DD87|nr:amidophosphoribosyltransferase [Francisella tularensis]MBN3663761.1 amidophosphoribosyltransferase [Francisella tularensis subsp. holarctica]MBN3666850.1 amidophosphoribosyltransferase [Francisella tularensis subsp. holarctica]MBN3668488.1 amidophosphoribosyltransferase [Francisella tularensis subsp. holarctica]MBN3706707.1 amidophosphoribosyltransferase [Francisella tularensis subsp. holarctica]MBN3709880.1 amidophosphoribosyltransferase [Francisella tularensis subsp. holarctica]